MNVFVFEVVDLEGKRYPEIAEIRYTFIECYQSHRFMTLWKYIKNIHFKYSVHL